MIWKSSDSQRSGRVVDLAIGTGGEGWSSLACVLDAPVLTLWLTILLVPLFSFASRALSLFQIVTSFHTLLV